MAARLPLPFRNLAPGFRQAGRTGVWIPLGAQIDRNLALVEQHIGAGEIIDFDEKTTDSGTTETTPLTVLSITVTVPPDRRLEVLYDLLCQNSASGTRCNMSLRDGPTSASTRLQLRNPRANVAADNLHVRSSKILSTTTAGSRTFSVDIARSGGGAGDTTKRIAAADFPSMLIVYDRGPIIQ